MLVTTHHGHGVGPCRVGTGRHDRTSLEVAEDQGAERVDRTGREGRIVLGHQLHLLARRCPVIVTCSVPGEISNAVGGSDDGVVGAAVSAGAAVVVAAVDGSGAPSGGCVVATSSPVVVGAATSSPEQAVTTRTNAVARATRRMTP